MKAVGALNVRLAITPMMNARNLVLHIAGRVMAVERTSVLPAVKDFI